MIVFETFALVKLLKKEPGYEKIAQAVEQGGFILDTTKYELFYDVVRDWMKQGHELHESLRKGIEIIEALATHLQTESVNERIMQESIYFKITYHQLNLSHFDCLALGAAKVLGVPLLSGEKGLAQVKEVKVVG
ncbi:hypothetical protein HYU22_01965 [Candidatus Woesearchaeota archaeon]|nr:hypothetical protein [Candidatus Woesearchaeota archaeon]